MKNTLLLLAAACLAAACSGHASLPEPFTPGTEAFFPEGSHIQGIAASEDALYASQDCGLVKLSWTGEALGRRELPVHTGDICWYKGELYVSMALADNAQDPLGDPTSGKGQILVFDKDLNPVRGVDVDRRVDGIACLDDVLYVGMGAKEQPSRNPHRINLFGRFDAKTLEEIAPRTELDYGYDTRYGAQNLCSDGKNVYISFYAVEGAPQIAVLDKDMNVVGTQFLAANQGLDVMPAKWWGKEGPVFIKAKTIKTRAPETPSVTCKLDYWTPSKEERP